MTSDVLSIDPQVYARRWKSLAVLSLSLLIIGLDNTILNVALPTLQEELGASASTLQWIVDAYLLVFAGLLLTMGAFGDRFGRKRALQSGVAIFGGASLGVLLVDTPNQLIAVRALMGVGAALIMPATLSIISNTFPRAERAKAIGIWTATAALGIGLGPLVGGLLLEWFSWRAVFLVNVPVALTSFVLAIRYVANSRDPKPGAFDLVGALLSIGALTTLVYAIIEAPSHGWLAPATLGCFSVAAALASAFLVWERRVAEPMLDLAYFREARFGIASVAISLAFFSLFGAAFAVTQYLQLAHGYSALQAGAGMLPIAFGLIVGAGSGTKLNARFGTKRVVAMGLAGLTLVQASTMLWSPTTPYWPLGLWFFGLALSLGWVMAPATDSVMGAVPEAKAGVASAMNDVARQVSGALGVAVVGSLVASLYSTRMEESTVGLPPASAETARDSIGGAVAVASQLPPDAAAGLRAASGQAFSDALGLGLLAAAAASLVGVLLVARFLPARHRTQGDALPLEPALLPNAA